VTSPWFSIGAGLGAIAVIGGAFGAHALSGRLAPDALALWETAARYLSYASLALLALGLAADRRPGSLWDAAGLCLTAGALIFSGSVGGLALGGPRWLGAVTPLGGLLLIAGFAAMALGGLRR
jgi:uncharacterized membrane protein YgdD (TMEM256/DUF423 family)